MVGSACLEQRLICTATSCDEADHGSAVVGDGLLGAGWKADAGHALVAILRDDDCVVARCAGHLAAISRLGFDIANHGAFRNLLARKDISDS